MWKFPLSITIGGGLLGHLEDYAENMNFSEC